MIDKMPIIEVLNDFATVFGAGVLVLGVIGIILSVAVIIWFSIKINDRVTYKHYEQDKILHKEEHHKLEDKIDKNFESVKDKMDCTKDLISNLGTSIARIEGHLFDKK